MTRRPLWPVALLLLCAYLAPGLIQSTFAGALHLRLTTILKEWKQ